MDSPLDERFGRCQYFLITDSQGEEVEVVDNGGIAAAGGAGVKAAQQLIDRQVEVVITGNLGPNALHVLGSAKIQAFSAVGMSSKEAWGKFNQGELKQITEAIK
jgi:predicted Fe-Mo cluster-binding NifX family protein